METSTKSISKVKLEQEAVPVAIPVLAGEISSVHSMVRLGGQLMDGGMVLSTVKVCTQDSSLVPSLTKYSRVIIIGLPGQPSLPEKVVRAVLNKSPQESIAVTKSKFTGGRSNSHSRV